MSDFKAPLPRTKKTPTIGPIASPPVQPSISPPPPPPSIRQSIKQQEEEKIKQQTNVITPPSISSKPPEGVEIPTLEYSPPPWGCSSKPKYPFFIEVIKDGTVIESIDISNKPFFVVGRLPTCEISLEHPSVSRLHAVIQHHKADDGRLTVYDLGSTHGTIVNKKRIQPKTHTVIMTGDVLKFGESTRLFIISGGPAREQVVNALIKERTAEQETQKQQTKESEEEETNGVNWGMYDDEDEEENHEDEEEKKKKRKQKNSDDENEDDDDDDDDDDEEYERVKEFQPWERLEDGDQYIASDDDEFFDRTGAVAVSKAKAMAMAMAMTKKKERTENNNGDDNSSTNEGGGGVLTHASLVERKEVLEKEMNELKVELEKCKKEEEVKQKSEKTNQTNPDGVADSLDLFMSTNTVSMSKEKIDKIEERLKALENELLKVNRFIQLTKPAIEPIKQHPKQQIVTTTTTRSDEPEKKKLKLETKPILQQQPQKKRTAKDRVPEQANHPPPEPQQQQQRQHQTPKQKQNPPQIPKFDDESDPSVAWQPPPGQTGDGTTPLNAKFGY